MSWSNGRPVWTAALVLLAMFACQDQRTCGAEPAERLDPWGDPLPEGARFRTGSIRSHREARGPIRFSPDGQILAMVCRDDVLLCEAKTGKEIRRLSGHKDLLYCFVFSSNGKMLAS